MKQISVAIVTGASQGIGRATAIRLAKDFTAVVLVARNAEVLKDVADAVRTAGAEPLIVAVDLSRAESAEAVVKATLDRFGRIDAVVNNAGAVPRIDLFEMTDEQWYAAMELKFHGARRLTIRAWEALKASKGSVVFMAGAAALEPKAFRAAVAAINAAIIVMAKAFAERGLEDGVQVNSIVPGPVNTGRLQSFFERWAPAHNLSIDEAKKTFLNQAGMSRYGEPEEIAELMAFLVSPLAKWMTGSSVRMDGGEVKGI